MVGKWPIIMKTGVCNLSQNVDLVLSKDDKYLFFCHEDTQLRQNKWCLKEKRILCQSEDFEGSLLQSNSIPESPDGQFLSQAILLAGGRFVIQKYSTKDLKLQTRRYFDLHEPMNLVQLDDWDYDTLKYFPIGKDNLIVWDEIPFYQKHEEWVAQPIELTLAAHRFLWESYEIWAGNNVLWWISEHKMMYLDGKLPKKRFFCHLPAEAHACYEETEKYLWFTSPTLTENYLRQPMTPGPMTLGPSTLKLWRVVKRTKKIIQKVNIRDPDSYLEPGCQI